MNTKVCTAVALMAVAMDSAMATFVFGTGAAVAGGSTLAIGGGSAAALGLLGGVVLLKGLVLGAALLSSRSRGGSRSFRGRGKRSADDETDAAYFALQQAETSFCTRRMICDMATGAFPKSDNDVIMQLFSEDAPISSPKFEYVSAAKLGKTLKSIQTCEIRYSCPLSSEEIAKLFL